MITVQPKDFVEASKKMEDAANKIDNSLKRIDTIMGSLDTVWKDKNSTAYLNKYRELQKDFPLFKASLHRYSEFLNSLLDIYNKEFNN